MMFCPKCGSMLVPKATENGKVMSCSCGYTSSEKPSMKEKVRRSEDVFVVEEEHSVNPVVDMECPKCKNPKAENWSQQMRAGDEPETIFYKCTKCKHTWREVK